MTRMTYCLLSLVTINKQITAYSQKYRFIERAPKELLEATLEAVFSEIEIFGAD